jgi:hypothetical protein
MMVGIGAITYVYEGSQVLTTNRRYGTQADVRIYPIAIAIAAILVIASRFFNIHPSVVFGFVAAYVAITPAAFSKDEEGEILLVGAFSLLALSLIAWIALIPIRELSEDGGSLTLLFLESTAAIIFLGGVEGLLFNLIPVKFMDGLKLLRWRWWLWFILSGGLVFLFWHVLINREHAYDDALRQTSVIALLLTLGICLGVTVVTWLYFTIRTRDRAGA